jgi:hypothetical protein
MEFFDKGYSIQQTNKRFKLKMAMKKPTKSDLKAGRVYRCSNCDAFCGDDIAAETRSFVMGRPQHKCTEYYCDKACAYKHSRDTLRPKYEKNIEKTKGSESCLKELLENYILNGKKSKTLFQAIKMVRQYNKTLTMLLSGDYPLHIMKVEYFKVSEAAMELAELVGEEEDPVFNKLAKKYPGMGSVTEILAQNVAMHCRGMAEDKEDSLSLWFN